MRRTLAFVFAAALLAACSAEHGAAPAGTFAPGGPIDRRGNSATSRALGSGSAEGPTAPDDPEALGPGALVGAVDPERIADRQDAGAIDEEPLVGRSEGVEGRVVAASEEELRIAPARGAPISLRLDETAQVTLQGTLVTREEIREGAQVRASYRMVAGQPVAENVQVLRLHGAEPADEAPAMAPETGRSP